MNPDIRKLRKLFANAGSFVCNIPASDSALAPELFVRRNGRGASVVPQAETCVELGHPSMISASLLLSIADEHDVNNNQITVFGNDIGRLEKGRHSFAQILLVGGPHVMPEHLSNVRTLLGAAGNLNGCMVKLMGEKIWARISKEAVATGFSFGVWGRCLFDAIRNEVPPVEHLEAIFVAGVDALVDEISQIAKTAGEERRQQLIERLKQTGGDYECENPYDCKECPDKPECDVLKEVAGIVKHRAGKSPGGWYS